MYVNVSTGIWKNFPEDDSYLLYSGSAFKDLVNMEFDKWAVPGLVIHSSDIETIKSLSPKKAINLLAKLVIQAHNNAVSNSWNAFCLDKFIDFDGELICSLFVPNKALASSIVETNCKAKMIWESPDVGRSVTINKIDGVNCILIVNEQPVFK